MSSGEIVAGQRDLGANAVHLNHGSALKGIANNVGIHYTTVNRVMMKAAVRKK